MIFKKRVKAEKRSPIGDKVNEPQELHNKNNLYSVAFVLDDEVQEVIRAEEKIAAILLSEPTIIDITNLDQKPTIGWKYNSETGEFLNEAVSKEE